MVHKKDIQAKFKENTIKDRKVEKKKRQNMNQN